MEDGDSPRPRGDFAGRLAGEDLTPLSLTELAQRIALLEAEIARTVAHRDRTAAHMHAADALFGKKA